MIHSNFRIINANIVVIIVVFIFNHCVIILWKKSDLSKLDLNNMSTP